MRLRILASDSAGKRAPLRPPDASVVEVPAGTSRRAPSGGPKRLVRRREGRSGGSLVGNCRGGTHPKGLQVSVTERSQGSKQRVPVLRSPRIRLVKPTPGFHLGRWL